MIRFACPGCQAIYNVKDDKAGKTGKCPTCGSQFLIPGEPAASDPAPPPLPAPPPIPPIKTPSKTVPAVVEIEPCPTCNARLTVEASNIGVDIACPECSSTYLAVKLGSAPKASPAAAPRKSSFSGNSGASVADALKSMGPKAKPSERKSVRRDEEDEDVPYAVNEDDEEEGDRRSRRRTRSSRIDDEDDDDRPSRRKRRRSRRRNDGDGNRSTMRVISGILSLISGMGQLMCGGCFILAGGFVLSVLAGAASNRPGGAPPAVGNEYTLLIIGFGMAWIFMAILNIVAGIGAFMGKPFGRVLTIVVSALAAIGCVFDLLGGGYALISGNFVQVLFSIVSFLFAAAHAVTGFMATIGNGAAEEFNQ